MVLTFRRVPPNCSFEVDDVEKPWLWKEPFDFIHSAYLSHGIRDWPKYTKRMYENLVPGGVVQLLEFNAQFLSDDNCVPKGGYLERYLNNFNKASGLAGLHDSSELQESYLGDAGFIDIMVVIKKLPIGSWPKDPKKKVSQHRSWTAAGRSRSAASRGPLEVDTRHGTDRFLLAS